MRREDVIEAIVFFYGVTKTRARIMMREYSEERCRLLVEGWRKECGKSFYHD